MTIRVRTLAEDTGWCVADVVCTAGPKDAPYEEQHAATCIALVTEGSFQYRCALGRTTLVPNSLLLGNCGEHFQCEHEHGCGDRCLSFQFTPEFLEPVAAAVPGVRTVRLSEPRLPPSATLLPVLAAAQATRDGKSDGISYEELAVSVAGAVFEALTERRPQARASSCRDEQRVAAALRRIDANPHHAVSLQELAREGASSSYHFLRIFRDVVGLTPGQYVLNRRLHRAAVRLRLSDLSIASVAYDCGFTDLSTFNRQFRRAAGVSPGTYRSAAGRKRA